MEVENSEDCKFELAIVSTISEVQFDLFIQDDIGRNVKVEVEDENFKILKISNYNLPEKIQDWSLDKRILFEEFFKRYFSTRDLKNVFSINNKIVIQQDENVNLFSLKNSKESRRFLNILQEYMISEKRADAIFVYDTNTIQRKYLYKILEEKGIDKNKLYRQSTTFSKRK